MQQLVSWFHIQTGSVKTAFLSWDFIRFAFTLISFISICQKLGIKICILTFNNYLIKLYKVLNFSIL